MKLCHRLLQLLVEDDRRPGPERRPPRADEGVVQEGGVCVQRLGQHREVGVVAPVLPPEEAQQLLEGELLAADAHAGALAVLRGAADGGGGEPQGVVDVEEQGERGGGGDGGEVRVLEVGEVPDPALGEEGQGVEGVEVVVEVGGGEAGVEEVVEEGLEADAEKAGGGGGPGGAAGDVDAVGVLQEDEGVGAGGGEDLGVDEGVVAQGAVEDAQVQGQLREDVGAQWG